MYYYYGGKEKKAGEIQKKGEIAPFEDFDRMMQKFQREFDDFWAMPPWRMRRAFRMMPWRTMAIPSVDVEDQGKDYRVAADLPGYNKEDVNIEVTDDSLVIEAKKSQAQEDKQKNYVRKERMAQTFYRRVELPEKVVSDDAKASLKDGILEIILPKKEPTAKKKLAIT